MLNLVETCFALCYYKIINECLKQHGIMLGNKRVLLENNKMLYKGIKLFSCT